jgi:hypothetical protein
MRISSQAVVGQKAVIHWLTVSSALALLPFVLVISANRDRQHLAGSGG